VARKTDFGRGASNRVVRVGALSYALENRGRDQMISTIGTAMDRATRAAIR